MKIKIATFNISGGFYCGDESQEYLDREAATSVDNRLLNEIIDNINKENIDIICFQEIITTKATKYIDTIVNNTNLKYFESFELSPCNLVKDTDCGLALLSKYPITKSIKEIFTNPKLSKTTSSGNTYYTYDKGYIVSSVNINGKDLKLLTHHGFPFRRFNSTPEKNTSVFQEFDQVINSIKPNIITGDFNAENFMDLMPKTNSNYKRVFNEITTVDEMKFDDILINKESNYVSKRVIKSLSDHYMLLIEIEV
jgi:endonuclease/exonuclease/phosphatase family metal-dependent hydrolase